MPATTAEKQLTTLRVIYCGIGASAVTYPIVAQMLAPPGMIATPVYAAFTVVAVGLGIFSVVLRKSMLGRAEQLSDQSQRDAAMRLWLFGHVISFLMAEAVMVIGLVTRFAGATLKQALPLYALGIAVLLMTAPQRFEAPGA